jgi:Metallo-peptidase family M12B Reprolysin-like
MFSVSHYDCATGYYSFGHEIGHNFGMNHDRGFMNTCSSRDAFNYGYIDPSADFRTILSYDCTVGQCDNVTKQGGCPRIQRFSTSNTSCTYNGRAIGNAITDNARQFNLNRAVVAAFFPAMNCQSNAECNDKNSNTTDTCNTANKACVFTPVGNIPVNSPMQTPPMAPPNAPTNVNTPMQPPPPPMTPPAVPTNVPPAIPTQPIATSPTDVKSKNPTLLPNVPSNTVPVVTQTNSKKCGLFGLSLFCPRRGKCGLLRRLLRIGGC